MKGRIKMLFIEYPKCTTCKRAKTWLDEHGLEYTDRHIKEANPTLAELKDLYQLSGLPLKKFFNTSGVLYKQMQLKDKLPQLSEQEQLELLASDGMLVKRPLLVLDDVVLVGFKPEQWAERLK
jgi:arsenate reductase